MDGLFDSNKSRENLSCAIRSQKQQANDILFEPLARFFFASGVGPKDAKRIMAVISNLRPKNATPEQITARISNWERVFPSLPAGSITIEALCKHWDKLGKPPAGTEIPFSKRPENQQLIRGKK